MKKITNKWLKENNACQGAVDWLKTIENRNIDNLFNLIISSKNNEKLSWGNWGIARLMNHHQKIRYAVFAAEQAIDIFEKKYPNDDRPRKAIEAAKKYLENQTHNTADAADAAAYAARAAADAAAYAAAYAARAAADAAAYAAAYAADAAYAAAYAADAAHAAAYAAADAAIELKIKILTYGMELIKNENKT